jgi:hypothetical protein
MASEGTPFDMVDGGSYDADKAYKDSKVSQQFGYYHRHQAIKILFY